MECSDARDLMHSASNGKYLIRPQLSSHALTVTVRPRSRRLSQDQVRFISTPAGKLMITESLQGKPNSHHETIHLTDKTPGQA